MKKINSSFWAKSAFAAMSVALWVGHVEAAPIPTLFNTGVVSGTTLVADGASDSHWNTNIGGAFGASAGGPGVLSNPAPGAGDVYWVGSTNPSGQTSSWISPFANHIGTAVANYTYSTTFNLTGFNLSSVAISGVWASDNQLQSIKLNGQTITNDALNPGGYAAVGSQRQALHSFTLAALSAFYTTGINTLEFVVNNALLFGQTDPAQNPTGLRVEFEASADAAVDAPSTLGLLGLGMAALTVLRRRKI